MGVDCRKSSKIIRAMMKPRRYVILFPSGGLDPENKCLDDYRATAAAFHFGVLALRLVVRVAVWWEMDPRDTHLPEKDRYASHMDFWEATASQIPFKPLISMVGAQGLEPSTR
jgi:hypothetical protein